MIILMIQALISILPRGKFQNVTLNWKKDICINGNALALLILDTLINMFSIPKIRVEKQIKY